MKNVFEWVVRNNVLLLPKPNSRELDFDGDVVNPNAPYGDSITNFVIDVFVNNRENYSVIKINPNMMPNEILISTKAILTNVGEILGMHYHVDMSSKDAYHINIRMQADRNNKFKEALNIAIKRQHYYGGGSFYEPPVWDDRWNLLNEFEINDMLSLKVIDKKIYLRCKGSHRDTVSGYPNFTKADEDAWNYLTGMFKGEVR